VAKKLSDIADIVNSSSEEFLEYIKRNVDAEVHSFLMRLAEVNDVYIFSGVIRNFFLQKEEIRDLDIVIRDDINIELLVPNSISVRRNSFGGYKINISETNIDLWTLEKTWAVQYQKRLELDSEVDNLHRFIPSTAFFNFSAILFSLNEKKFYYKTDFLSFLQNREINYLYKPNANVSLCVVNTLYYANEYNLAIADKLKRYLIQLYKTKLEYNQTQLKHFGKILYTEEYINNTISNFKLDKIQRGDYLMANLEEIYTRLGLNKDNGLFYTHEDTWKNETAFPNRVKRLIEKDIKPKAFFCFDNKPLILFFENPPNKHALHKAIWNFNECPISIIIENNIVEIFNGFDFDLKSKLLKVLGKDEKLDDFSYFRLVSGNTWEKHQELLNYKKRVDYHLLRNIQSARKQLVEQNLSAKIANAIIGKAIFVRYLIDRKVKINFDGELRTWSNNEFSELLSYPEKIKSFFDYLENDEKGFKGDIFPLSDEEFDEITLNQYKVIKRLLNGENIESGQLSLFDFYDFAIIPIEFISNVYEMFIGQENQKKEGAYYTPLFLVDYILKETVEKEIFQSDRKVSALSKNTSDFAICKVLDPACGSGIFLVETLRKVIEKFISDSGIEVGSEEFKIAIKRLAQDNIYGIDKDLSAVQVAIFSIYLTLLDYLEPKEIETFTFPELFNTNFFEADFFDENSTFNSILNKVSFQFILGNPPWKGNGMDDIGNTYLKNRSKKEKHKKYPIAINNNEIAEAFVLRVSDFCSATTRISLIIRSSSLYNLGYNDNFSPFRQYWLEEYFVDRVFELAPVRHEVFEKSNQPAVAPAAVLFYRYARGENTDKNVVEHIALKQSRFFSLFKVFTINRSDYKLINQQNFKLHDWIWKVLVYGSYLDFNFIKRLKDNFPTVKNIVSNKDLFVESTGLHSRTLPLKETKNTSIIEGISFLKTEAITSFYIDYDKIGVLEKEKIDIIKDVRIYHHPMLLIREGIDMKTLTAKCAISTKDVLFKDSITSIKAIDEKQLNVLHNIASIFSTNLFMYYAINIFSSIGVERERVKNYNKYSLPYINMDVSSNVENIETAQKKLFEEQNTGIINNIEIDELNSIIKKELKSINKTVIQSFEIDETENALINYCENIAKILIVGDASSKRRLFSPIPFKSELLFEYAQVFKSRFKKLENGNNKFIIEIWHTNQLIGMFFKIIPRNDYKEEIEWIDKQTDDLGILNFLAAMGISKITEKLFVQKDIRGFEKDYFYIFKPNEMKLWHSAIAYLDVNEFTDAILKEGGKRHDI